MRTSTNFTEKPKSLKDQIEDDAELAAFHERTEDIEDDEDDFEDEDNFVGMNVYEPYAGYEGGEY